VRTEAFITLVVPESRLGKAAKEPGAASRAAPRSCTRRWPRSKPSSRAGGVHQRGVADQPRAGGGLPHRVRPRDRAGIIDALTAHTRDPHVNADVPWAMAGPSGADAVARHYSHDAWNSISATIKLPVKGAVMGALAPILAPPGRGSGAAYLVAFPILSHAKATGSPPRASGPPTWVTGCAPRPR
jgi:hypothetical protein